MTYDINKAFLATNAGSFAKATQGQNFYGPNGSRWQVINTTPDDLTSGYQGALVKNLGTGKYELISRPTEPGREPLKDGVADIQMALGKLPDQVQSARDFLAEVRKDIIKDGGNPNTDLSLVGTSLGGSITQVLGAENPQLKADSFNPFGVGNLVPPGEYPNVTSHVMAKDFVSVSPGSKMIGATYMYEEPVGVDTVMGSEIPTGAPSLTLASHFASNFLDPSVSAQAGVAVQIDVPRVGADSDGLGALSNTDPLGNFQPGIGDAADSSSESEISEIVITAPRSTLDNYLNTEGATLTPKQQDALASQLDKLNLGGEQALSFYPLPSGGVLIANADGDIVGEILHSESGSLNLRATGIDINGNTVEVNTNISEQGQSLTEGQYNAQVQQQATNMFNSLIAVNNWDHLTDVGKLSAFVNLYNSTDKLGEAFNATGDNLPGDLGAAAGYLQLAQGLQSGDNLVIANGINVISDGALDGAMNQAFGTTAAGEAVPYLSYALAVRNFAENPEQAIFTGAGTYVGEAFGAALGGPIGAAIGGAIGGMIGGSLGSAIGISGDDPPPSVGSVHFSWDAKGNIQHTVDFSVSGGGDTANSVAASVLGLLQSLVDAHNAQNASTADDIAINPYCLPTIHFKADWEGATVEIPTRDGHVAIHNLNTADFGQWLVQTIQDTGGVAPAWQVQTIQAHVQQQRAAGVDEIEISREAGITATVGSHAGDAAYSVQGNAAESADFTTQRFGAMVVHFDIDGDGYLEQTQWLQSNQAVLVVDLNGDGQISVGETVSLQAANDDYMKVAA